MTEEKHSPPDMTAKELLALADLRNKLDRFLSILDSDDVDGIKLLAPRISFYEKLLLLDSATLTLLFTVIGNMANHIHQKGAIVAVGCFKTGCWLLAISIIGCLIHNNLNLAATAHFSIFKLTIRYRIRKEQLNRAFVNLGQANPLSDSDSQPGGEGGHESAKTASSLERWSYAVGFFAQMATIIAFVALVIFINANISTVL